MPKKIYKRTTASVNYGTTSSGPMHVAAIPEGRGENGKKNFEK